MQHSPFSLVLPFLAISFLELISPIPWKKHINHLYTTVEICYFSDFQILSKTKVKKDKSEKKKLHTIERKEVTILPMKILFFDSVDWFLFLKIFFFRWYYQNSQLLKAPADLNFLTNLMCYIFITISSLYETS